MAQHLCNVDYENEMAFVAVIGERENEKVIGSSFYVVDCSDNLAEVAYMIRPEWQKCGLGSALQQRMIEYALSKDLRGFKANILVENIKMQEVIKVDQLTMRPANGGSPFRIAGPTVVKLQMLRTLKQ
jgi:RimJ/RimL family protein N-acetyltransferase